MPEGHPEAFTETDVASGGGSKGGGLRRHCPTEEGKGRRSPPPCDDGTHKTAGSHTASAVGGATYLFTYGGFVNNNYHARAPRRRAQEERSDEKP